MFTRRNQDAALLATLFAADGQRVSCRKLAAAAGIAAEDVEDHLVPYLDAGYPIEFHPQGGIALLEPPDIWCAEEIVGRCPAPARRHPAVPVWDPVLLAQTTSTNDVARQQGRKGANAGLVVAASRQTKGRGRLGRPWESPPAGGLYSSILLRPDLAMPEAGRLTILSSVAMADAVEAVAGLRPQIKWPNDLMLSGQKLGGLLIETEPKGKRVGFAVVGIGLNVRQQAEDFSAKVRGLATSLYMAKGHYFRRADLLVALLQALEQRLVRPFDEAREAWIAAGSLTLGQRVTLTTTRGRKYGQAVGLDESGALLVRSAEGEVEAITAGDMQAC